MWKPLLLPWLFCKPSIFFLWHAECWLNPFPCIVTYVGKHVRFECCWTICSSKGCSWLTLVDFYGIVARKGRPLWLKSSKTSSTFHMQCHRSKGRLQHRARNPALPNSQLREITKQVWTRLRGKFRNLPFLGKKARCHSLKWKLAGPSKPAWHPPSETPIYKKVPWQTTPNCRTKIWSISMASVHKWTCCFK